MYTVPDGTYLMKLSVLKALGDASNPARLGDLDITTFHHRSAVSNSPVAVHLFFDPFTSGRPTSRPDFSFVDTVSKVKQEGQATR